MGIHENDPESIVGLNWSNRDTDKRDPRILNLKWASEMGRIQDADSELQSLKYFGIYCVKNDSLCTCPSSFLEQRENLFYANLCIFEAQAVPWLRTMDLRTTPKYQWAVYY